MDIKKIAEQHIEDTLTKGFITLANHEFREVATSTIVALSRTIVKDALSQNKDEVSQENLPEEMFSPKEEESD